MTRWPLLIAVVACAVATVEAGCYRLTKSKEADTTYSKRQVDGRYPSGTVAHIHCPGTRYKYGFSTYTCRGDTWEATIISSCARDCTFDVVKGMHYSMVIVDNTPTRADIPHRKSAYLVCGKERHQYFCQDGFLSSPKGERCGNCAVELATKLGYTNMTSTELSYGDVLNGFYVKMWCREKQETFRCENNRFVPATLHAQTTVSVMCGCPPVQEPESFVRHFNISSSPVDDSYKHGTTVTLSCTSGPVLGAKQIKCVSGKWDGRLGKCPKMCDATVLQFGGGVSAMLIKPQRKPPTTLQIHGGQLLVRCKPPLVAASGRRGFRFMCKNGKWNRPGARCIRPQTNTKST